MLVSHDNVRQCLHVTNPVSDAHWQLCPDIVRGADQPRLCQCPSEECQLPQAYGPCLSLNPTKMLLAYIFEGSHGAALIQDGSWSPGRNGETPPRTKTPRQTQWLSCQRGQSCSQQHVDLSCSGHDSGAPRCQLLSPWVCSEHGYSRVDMHISKRSSSVYLHDSSIRYCSGDNSL